MANTTFNNVKQITDFEHLDYWSGDDFQILDMLNRYTICDY